MIKKKTPKTKRAYELSYSPKERAERQAYKKKNGMFPEDNPRNYPKAKGKTITKKKMRGGTVKKKMRGGKVKK